jgi:hypothetical protein
MQCNKYFDSASVMLILGYKVDEVEGLYTIIHEILENGNVRKTPSQWETATVWLEIHHNENIGGSLGMETRNQRDQMLITFYVGKVVITNTWFKRILNTWRAPGD